MTKSKPELKITNFENSIKQTIRPGDPIIIVTSGYNHRVNIRAGTYLGKKNDGVSCRVTEQHTHYRYKETGEEVGFAWNTHSDKLFGKLEYPGSDWSIRHGQPGYEEQVQRNKDNADRYGAEFRRRLDMYEPFKVPYYRHTTLQLNRIFKIDTPAVDLTI